MVPLLSSLATVDQVRRDHTGNPVDRPRGITGRSRIVVTMTTVSDEEGERELT